MKNFIRLFSGFLLFTFLISPSCVTRKKYDDLSASKLRLEAEKADCDEKLKAANAEIERLSDLSTRLQKEVDNLKADTTRTGEALRRTMANHKMLNDSYEKLLKNYDKLQYHSTAESSKLSSDLQKREKELLESEKRIIELQANLSAREARVKELEKVLADKEQAVNDLKAKVSKALLSFKEKDLTVEIKNGKVYVSLSEQLLFKSGSTTVDPKGVEALKKLADVLKDQKDVSVMVEGHTDDVPVAKGTVGVKDNWDLSVLRATEIVRILVSAGVDPKKLNPSGKGEFSPVAEGKSAEARQKNRRTEIILTPKLDELFQILEAN
jgi:chemotaxis protein MotB